MSQEATDIAIKQALIYAEELKELYEREAIRSRELERAKAALELSLEQVREAERLKDEFIANCSHELRTPLTPILGWANILRDKDLAPGQVKESGEVIARQAEKLIGVVDSLLRVLGIERSRDRKMEHAELSVPSLLETASRPIISAGRKVSISVDDSLVINSNPEYLGDALSRLVDNALKFGYPDTSIQLRAHRVADHIVFEVEDEGPGIPLDKRSDAFQSFVQGDGSTTRTHGGLGLGLYITRQLSEALGGGVEIADGANGALLRLTLPQRREAELLLHSS